MAIFASWVAFSLRPAVDDGGFPGPGDGLFLLSAMLMGVVIGFWGGVCLVLYLRYKPRRDESSLPIGSHLAT
jgi:hypothetical protein